MRRATSPTALVRQAETQARARLQREYGLNAALLRANPSLLSTERYMRGPLPSTDPRFYSELQRLDYETRRQMGRFDKNVRYPAPPPRRRAR